MLDAYTKIVRSELQYDNFKYTHQIKLFLGEGRSRHGLKAPRTEKSPFVKPAV